MSKYQRLTVCRREQISEMLAGNSTCSINMRFIALKLFRSKNNTVAFFTPGNLWCGKKRAISVVHQHCITHNSGGSFITIGKYLKIKSMAFSAQIQLY